MPDTEQSCREPSRRNDNDGDEFIDTVRIVCEHYGTTFAMLNARSSTAMTQDARKVLDCAILYKCYLKFNRPNYIKNRITEIWNSLCSTEAPLP